MNDSDPIDSESLALLRKDFTNPGPEVQARVSSRLTSSIGSLTLRAASVPRPQPGWRSIPRGHSLGFIASFVLGGACGAGLFAALQRTPEPLRVFVDRPLSQAAPPVAVSSEPELPIAPVLTASTAAKPAAPASAQRGAAGLAEQQALLDVARSAFGRGDYSQTLKALRAHFERFPNSVLGEEREALEIKALAESGRVAEAKSRAARFATRFPQSLLLPSINESVKQIP